MSKRSVHESPASGLLLLIGALILGFSVMAIPGVLVTLFDGGGPVLLMVALTCGLAGALMCWPAWHTARDAVEARDRGLRAHATIDAITRVNALQVVIEWRFTDLEERERRGQSLLRPIAHASHWSVGQRILVYYGDDQADAGHRLRRSWWRADVGPPRPSSFTRG